MPSHERTTKIDPVVNRLAVVFPGQGSQIVGMGRDLCEASPPARATYEEANDALGYDLARVCFEGPAELLSRTDVTQPALLTTSIALLRALAEKGLSFAVALGHSLGEYTALVATGSLDFAEAVALVRTRGEAMLAAAEASPGGMAAVIGLEASAVEELCSAIGGVWPANFNSPGQVVVSGTERAIDELSRRAPGAGARRVVRLAVSGAFHSPLVAPAAEAMRAPLAGARFATPRPAFFSTCSVSFEPQGRQPEIIGRSQPETSGRSQPEPPDELGGGLAGLMLRQIISPVRWEQSVRALVEAGYDAFLEVGPGNVLTGLIKRIDNGVTTGNVADVATLQAALAASWTGGKR